MKNQVPAGTLTQHPSAVYADALTAELLEPRGGGAEDKLYNYSYSV